MVEAGGHVGQGQAALPSLQHGDQQQAPLIFQPRDILWRLQLLPLRNEPAGLMLSDSSSSKCRGEFQCPVMYSG